MGVFWGLVDWTGRERGGREEPRNSHLNLRVVHKLQAERQKVVIDMMHTTECFVH